MQSTSTVTSKGQVLLPIHMRKQLGIMPADRVLLAVTKSSITLKKAPTVASMFGSVPFKKALTDEELEQKIAEVTSKSSIKSNQ